MFEPRAYVWVIPNQLAVAERPGGGGRSHRRFRRERELDWWLAQGVTALVSGMRTRHGLLDAGLAGLRIVWHPLVSPDQARHELVELVRSVRDLVDDDEVVLVHVDRPSEWLCAVDAALRREFRLARTRADALRQATDDGWPAGELAAELLAGSAVRRDGARQAA